LTSKSAAPDPANGSARLFFALWPEIGVRKALAAWQRKLQAGGNSRALHPWTLHLTLVFLGPTPLEQLDAVKAAAAGARASAAELLFDEAGYWPHNQIVWVGCKVPPPALIELQSALAARLTAAGIAFDAKPFQPHVTLLRNVRTAKSELPHAIVEWPVRDFVLVESTPATDGSRYQIVARFPLR
jgi:2'-5' RNA ligase